MEKSYSPVKGSFIYASIIFAPVVTLFLFFVLGALTMQAGGEQVMLRWVAPLHRLGVPLSADGGFVILLTCLIGTPLWGALACGLRLRKSVSDKGVTIQFRIIQLTDVLLLVVALFVVVGILLTT